MSSEEKQVVGNGNISVLLPLLSTAVNMKTATSLLRETTEQIAVKPVVFSLCLQTFWLISPFAQTRLSTGYT